jgi:hypothetical protein
MDAAAEATARRLARVAEYQAQLAAREETS